MRKELDDPRQILRQKVDCKYPGSRGPFSKYLIWNKTVVAPHWRGFATNHQYHKKKISSGTPDRLQAVYSKLRLLKFTRDDVPRSRIQGKKRVEGGRAIAKSSGATDWQYSRTDGRNSSPVNSQFSSLKKELTWQIEDFSCDHVLIPSNIRSYPRQRWTTDDVLKQKGAKIGGYRIEFGRVRQWSRNLLLPSLNAIVWLTARGSKPQKRAGAYRNGV